MPAAKKKSTTKGSTAENFLQAPINANLSSEEKCDLYRTILGIRRFEERSLQAYNQGKIGGFLHLYIGQEAVAAGVVSLMEENDHIITAYRDHGHALAVGMSMNECMAEMYGKHTGCSKGKGGSMHFFAPEKNYWGGHGIVAGQTPLGAGLAFALKYKGLKGCCVCFLGDGAVNQGSFMETLNLVSLWGIPVVFVIENNGYSMGTSLARSSAIKSCLAERATGYDMDWDIVNGENLYEVRAKTWEAMQRARSYWRDGKVLSSDWKPPLLKGVVQAGSTSYQSGLVIKSAIDVENLCRCKESRNWGVICAHSLAIGIHAIKGDDHDHDEPSVVKGPEAEADTVAGAIRTDFILSAEIMVISLKEVIDEAFAES